MFLESTTIPVLNKILHCINDTRRKLASTGEAFSPFRENLIYMGETGISGILAMLLSPERSHYQGAHFLNNFISILPNALIDTPVDASYIKVSTERFTKENCSKRFIDIVVEGKDFILAVENKIWAGDQYRQVADYLNWLKFVSNGRQFFLVYITPYGHSPSDYSLPPHEALEYKGHYSTLSWVDVTRMLKQSAKQTPQKISFFINDFCDALMQLICKHNESEFSMDSEITKTIADKLTLDELIAAQAIYDNYEKAKKFIVNRWSKQLENGLNNLKIDGTIERYPYPNYDGEETVFFKVIYNEQKLETGLYTINHPDKEVLAWGVWVQSWNLNDGLKSCMADPSIRAAMQKFKINEIHDNNIICNTCDNLSLNDPILLDRLRQPDDVYLLDELFDICKTIEHIAYNS